MTHPQGPPVAQAIWSSRDVVGEEHLATFREVGRRLVTTGKHDPAAVLALRTATGLLTTAQGAALDALEAGDLVAVVDVDPVREVMMVRGPGEPSPWAALLSMVMRYREDATGAVFLPTPTGDNDPSEIRPPKQAQSHQEKDDASGASSVDGQQQSPRSAMETTRSRGWGFEEPVAPNPVDSQGVSGLADWAAWALKKLRNAPMAVSATGHVLSVGRNLHAAGRAIEANGAQSR